MASSEFFTFTSPVNILTAAEGNLCMRNIFLLYMPPGNAEAMVHYDDTIRSKVAFDRIARHVTSGLARKLNKYSDPTQSRFGDRGILRQTARGSIE
jgi:hypothetical protein